MCIGTLTTMSSVIGEGAAADAEVALDMEEVD